MVLMPVSRDLTPTLSDLQEIEALRQAKAILSGAKLEGFLQRK